MILGGAAAEVTGFEEPRIIVTAAGPEFSGKLNQAIAVGIVQSRIGRDEFVRNGGSKVGHGEGWPEDQDSGPLAGEPVGQWLHMCVV